MTRRNENGVAHGHTAAPQTKSVHTERAEVRLARFQQDIRASQTYRSVEAREDFLDRIHDVMETQGVSRAELARRMGKGRAYVTHLLGGGRNFSFDVAAEICAALGQTFCPDIKPEMSEVAFSSGQKNLYEYTTDELAAMAAGEFEQPQATLRARPRATPGKDENRGTAKLTKAAHRRS